MPQSLGLDGIRPLNIKISSSRNITSEQGWLELFPTGILPRAIADFLKKVEIKNVSDLDEEGHRALEEYLSDIASEHFTIKN